MRAMPKYGSLRPTRGTVTQDASVRMMRISLLLLLTAAQAFRHSASTLTPPSDGAACSKEVDELKAQNVAQAKELAELKELLKAEVGEEVAGNVTMAAAANPDANRWARRRRSGGGCPTPTPCGPGTKRVSGRCVCDSVPKCPDCPDCEKESLKDGKFGKYDEKHDKKDDQQPAGGAPPAPAPAPSSSYRRRSNSCRRRTCSAGEFDNGSE